MILSGPEFEVKCGCEGRKKLDRCTWVHHTSLAQLLSALQNFLFFPELSSRG